MSTAIMWWWGAVEGEWWGAVEGVVVGSDGGCGGGACALPSAASAPVCTSPAAMAATCHLTHMAQ